MPDPCSGAAVVLVPTVRSLPLFAYSGQDFCFFHLGLFLGHSEHEHPLTLGQSSHALMLPWPFPNHTQPLVPSCSLVLAFRLPKEAGGFRSLLGANMGS